ncbi:MAG: hypothetical protein Q9157_005147 [Trypethelium eluteriae]
MELEAISNIGTRQMTARSTLDANTANFKSNRTAGSFSGPFSGNAPPYLDSESRRFGEQSLSSWGDVPALQSPPDDRGSIHNSDYFPGSGLASRDSSLPPSRHGHDATNLSAYGELPPRNHQSKSSFAIPRHVPSLSTQTNGGAYNDRPISQENDLNAHFRRMSLQHPDQSVNVQKPTLNLNGAPAHFSQGSQDLGSRRQSTSDFSQQIPSYNGNSLDHSRSYTPNRTPNVRGVPYRDRQVQNPSMNGDYHHQYPYYSAESTPPRAFGPSAMANGDNRGMANSSMALLQSRLRSLEQEQNFPPNLGPMMAASYQMPYGNSIPYGTPQTLSGVNVNGQFMPMPPIPSMVPLMEPPRGPRDHDIGHGMRSALLDEFKTNQKTKRYELKDIYDHIVEFSGDQHGSRFIQTKLETANSDEKDRVFREIQSNALQLMSDVFGNYVIQKFFEHGDQTQKRTLANKMKGQVFALSTQMYACRVVQKALEHVLTDQQASIVREIENRVMDCLRDQNGNHVIQKAIERVPAEHMQVIVKAFLGRVQELSTHPYGCRVIQRMLEHCEPQVKRSVLEEIQGCEATLIPDQYGNYVTQHAIELGSDEDRARVFELIKSQLLAFSQHKYASNVVEASLKHATNEQRREIMMTLREKDPRGESYLVLMIKDGFGNYVIQRLLDTLEKSDYIAFMDILQPEMVKAKRLASSKQVQATRIESHIRSEHPHSSFHQYEYLYGDDTTASPYRKRTKPSEQLIAKCNNEYRR